MPLAMEAGMTISGLPLEPLVTRVRRICAGATVLPDCSSRDSACSLCFSFMTTDALRPHRQHLWMTRRVTAAKRVGSLDAFSTPG